MIFEIKHLSGAIMGGFKFSAEIVVSSEKELTGRDLEKIKVLLKKLDTLLIPYKEEKPSEEKKVLK